MRYYSTTAGEMVLQTAVTGSDTTIVVDTTSGLPGSTPFVLILDYGLAGEEVVDVTAVAGANLTVTRGRDGTVAQAHPFGAKIRHGMTARDLRESREHEVATAAHGVGTVVGTTETQTLEGKTFQPSTDTKAVTFKARAGSTNPHTEVRDSSNGLVARWYENSVEFISGATIYLLHRFGGGPGLFKSISEYRVGADIHAIVGNVVSATTAKFLRLMNGASELFSVDALGVVRSAGAIITGTLSTTGAATVGGGLSVTGNTASTTSSTTGNATVGGNLAVTGTISGTPSDDTGWANAGFTAATGFSFTGQTTRRRNGMVAVQLNFTRTGATIAAGDIANVTVCDIPAGFIPSQSNGHLGGGPSGPSFNAYASVGGSIIMTTLDQDLANGAAFSVLGMWML